MKNYIGILFLLLLSSCGVSRTFLDTKEGSDYITKVTSKCPESGSCEFLIYRNSSLQIQSDGIGQMYYDMVFDADKSVFMYEFKKNDKESVENGNHTERIVFEMRNDVKQLYLEDVGLTNANMFYERHCFCKGQTGMFAINKGSLNVLNEGKLLIEINIQEVNAPFLISDLKVEIH